MYLLGFLLLAHSGYSAYEYNQIAHNIAYDKLDLLVECVVALVLILFASFSSIKNTPVLNLRNEPVQRAQYLKLIRIDKALSELDATQTGKFEELVNRKAFIDIKAKRQQYQDYIAKKTE